MLNRLEDSIKEFEDRVRHLTDLMKRDCQDYKARSDNERIRMQKFCREKING